MIHIDHLPIPDGGLVDNCPGCKRLASDPIRLLDNHNLKMYVDRTVRWMRDDMDAAPRSNIEYAAMSSVKDMITNVRILNINGLLQVITERNKNA